MGSAVFALGVLLGAIVVAGVDVTRAGLRMPFSPPAGVLLLAWLASTGALASVALPPLFAHRAAFRFVSPRFRYAIGAFEGTLLSMLGLVVEESPSITPREQVVFVLGFTVLGGLLALATTRWPRLARLACLSVACALFAGVELVPGRGKPWLRFAIDVTALGACGAILEGLRVKPVRVRAVVAAIVGFALAAPLSLLVRDVRGTVLEYGAHARSLLGWMPGLYPWRTTLGTLPCAGLRPEPASVKRSPLSSSAIGADVLFLTFDAMRWDQADAISAVWHELGPSARFTRAVSPAPRTENSFGALLRGVPTRTGGGKKKGLELPTIAHILAKSGYRTVQVPTHVYFGPGRWPNAGFELAIPEGFPQRRRQIVAAGPALRKALEVARSTPKPLLLWIHLMEGHEPYRFSGGQGPPTFAAQRRAFRELDARAAAFLREFKQSRAGRPLVVAILGDHGEEFGEHGGAFHSTSTYAEQVRVAFGVAGPGIGAATIDAPVSLASLPATLLDLLGLDTVRSITEPSLVGCIGSRDACPKLAVSQVIERGSPVGYTFERYRLLVERRHDIERLYDSTTDPLERKDIAPSEPELLATLRERARAFDRAHCVP